MGDFARSKYNVNGTGTRGVVVTLFLFSEASIFGLCCCGTVVHWTPELYADAASINVVAVYSGTNAVAEEAHVAAVVVVVVAVLLLLFPHLQSLSGRERRERGERERGERALLPEMSLSLSLLSSHLSLFEGRTGPLMIILLWGRRRGFCGGKIF